MKRVVALSWVVLLAGPLMAGENKDRSGALAESVKRGERFWRQIAETDPPEMTSARAVFAYALVLCEARRYPERLERVFEQAARFQDRDEKSPGFGNLRWTWRDAGVTDANAVEFCMQDGVLIWLRHRAWLPEPARKRLGEIIALAAEGCLRHRVPTSYTNIAIMNAANLIVLGETLQRADATEEGLRRLEGACLWTSQFGTFEYCSPTYYGPDLGGLRWIEANARHPRARELAVALLRFFWTDVALNWHPKFQKLTGSESRSYDYLRGLGSLDPQMVAAGWLDAPATASGDGLQALLGRWLPPADLRAMNVEKLPRLVRQRWGIRPVESRTTMIHADVALGTAAATYGSQDITLAVDLAGDRDAVRCYFIPDGREDPYGKIRYETSTARHMKALHLSPFWTAAQRSGDALGLVVYRPGDLAEPIVTNVQSHFVLRRANQGLWLAGRRIELPMPKAPRVSRVDVGLGRPLVVRYGTAAVGVRVIWTRAQDGQPGETALVDDGNPHGAIRLTIEHRRSHVAQPRAAVSGELAQPRAAVPPFGIESKSALPGAAIWVRIGSGLASDQAFDAWRKRFEADAKSGALVSDTRLQFSAPGQDGPVAVTAVAPFGPGGVVTLEPQPTRSILELDGRDVGRPILAAAAPLDASKDALSMERPLRIPASGAVAWEAEQGLVFPGMRVMEDADASGGKYVAQPKQEPVHSPNGLAVWPIQVDKAGQYYLWARVLAPNSESDSFNVRVVGGGIDWAQRRWDLRSGPNWTWQPVTLEKSKGPTALDLPAGLQAIEFRTRETGARVDRLWITPDRKAKPKP